jgi:hypothetical protein
MSLCVIGLAVRSAQAASRVRPGGRLLFWEEE